MMNDRFRFRVWNKKNKEMIYNAEIAYDGMNYNTSWQIGKNTNDGWVECFGYYLDYPEDYEVMQCTGLKDKNGKLIYEGDIVKTKEHNLCKEGELFKVFYEKTLCQFLGKSLAACNCIDLCDLYEEEVIGNIYENTELLESEG